ncbi:MAG: hypothetical protein OEY40_04960 [Candidatus Bathyarchaeota archaeon]|nr:hypothetical protein [Candidatus Bathyarchaeota archaeon]MDH5596048.1 hypothetical protein [Candidatus Bathyarchaeota archaeon]
MRQINDFVSRLGARINLDKNLVVKKQNRYFLLNKNLKRLISKDFFYAGVYLGKTKSGRFFPSFNLLRMIAEEKSNKIIVDGKTEWLFICGRDLFKQGIINVRGSKGKGDHTLILNRHGECLGFGKILCSPDREKEGVVVKNISDIGDFLRREK